MTNISQTRKVPEEFLNSKGRYQNIVRVSVQKFGDALSSSDQPDAADDTIIVHDLATPSTNEMASGDKKAILMSIESNGGDELTQLP